MSGNNAYFTTSPAMLMKRWQAAASPSPTPSITPSPSGCNCYENVYVDVTSGGTINWTLCNGCGPGGEVFITGNGQLITDPCCIDITTLSGTATFTIASYNTPCCGVPASPSVTPSVTPTVTPSISVTPTVTPSLTPTPTPSPCVVTIIFENSRKGVTFDSAEVNAVAVTYSSGTNFPIDNTQTGTFTSNQSGNYTFNICYSNPGGEAGRIILEDCNANTFCCDLQSGTNCCEFNDVFFDCNCTITVKLEVGAC